MMAFACRSLITAILGATILLVAPSAAHADGGAVLSQEVVGPNRVTLFGAPSPLRAGPADLSVMVQDAQTGAPVMNRAVTIEVTAAADTPSEAWVPPCCSMKTTVAEVPATHAAAQNKLLYAANLVLPASGDHEITVRITNPANATTSQNPKPETENPKPKADALRVTARVEPPAPPLASYWAYLAAPPILIAGFALNQRLRRRDAPRG